MEHIERVNTIDEYNRLIGIRTQHPLVSVADFSTLNEIKHFRKEYGFYCVFYKELECGTLKYGRSIYDYQAGTLVFIAPGQTLGVNDGGVTYNPRGMALMFHPDLLYGTPLARRMKDYSFFSYESNEALHMSDREKIIILNCFHEIMEELDHAIDKHTKQIVASNIETLLNHCVRFYERQFITREVPNRGLLSRLHTLLVDYYDSTDRNEGVPTVQFCASELCLSSNYFGDLIKRETGRTAQEYIHKFIVDRAKQILAEGEMNVSEVAYEMGFRYPHHFTRLFKKITGQTPNEFKININ